MEENRERKNRRKNVNIYRLLHKLFPLSNHKVLQFIVLESEQWSFRCTRELSRATVENRETLYMGKKRRMITYR